MSRNSFYNNKRATEVFSGMSSNLRFYILTWQGKLNYKFKDDELQKILDNFVNILNDVKRESKNSKFC